MGDYAVLTVTMESYMLLPPPSVHALLGHIMKAGSHSTSPSLPTELSFGRPLACEFDCFRHAVALAAVAGREYVSEPTPTLHLPLTVLAS